METTQPFGQATAALGMLGTPVHLYLLVSVLAAVAINGFAIAMVRVWNPSRETRPITAAEVSHAKDSVCRTQVPKRRS